MRSVFFLLFLIILTSILCKAQSKLYVLTEKDKKNYVLSANAINNVKLKDTIWRKERLGFLVVPLKLSNYSKDTLKYITMSCSWWSLYKTDSKDVFPISWGCDSNIPKVVTVLPHSSYTIDIPLLFNKNIKNRIYKFGIGMMLQRYTNEDQVFGLNPFNFFSEANTQNEIWTNFLEIPIDKSTR